VTTDSGLPERLSVPSTPYLKSRSVSACEPYREFVELGLQRGRNAMAIWQDLVTEHGFDHSYHRLPFDCLSQTDFSATSLPRKENGHRDQWP